MNRDFSSAWAKAIGHRGCLTHKHPLVRLAVPWVVLLLALAEPPEGAAAQEPADAEEVAKMLANPNATLGFLSFPIDYVRYGGDLAGASDQAAWKLSAQPSLPYPLGERTNLFVRPLIPVVFTQPVPDGAGGFDDRGVELGNISYDLVVGHTLTSGVVLMGGLVGSIPTATDDALGVDAWTLGPAGLLGYGAAWGFLGALFFRQWDIAGDDDFAVSGGQYFYTFNLPNAWQIQAQPTWAYNHNGPEGQRLTFPLGVGASKVLLMGSTPWKLRGEYWNYIAKPEAFGPAHQFRLTITPVVSLPW